MRNPMNRIEKFCYDHPNFGIRNLMRYITAANVAFWLLSVLNPTILSYITFSPAHILRGQVWRLVSFMFYPPNLGLFAFIAFYFYYWIGSTLEQYWGTAQFNVFFFSGVILNIVYGFIAYFVTGLNIELSSEYLFLSMFFSFAAMFPDTVVLFMFIIPIKMKYLAIADALYFLYCMIILPFPLDLLPLVAIVNFLIFCGGDLLRVFPRKPSANAVNFRKESRRIRREQEHKLYTHKCSVCGKTDVDYPNLEFRYCSRCAGYHCFCSEHINNHIHFTE